ncbi:extensin family protein [Rhizobium sp. TRM95111]|uniref:extensin-like domain-containing protein n=1 Tax=Rhizobium alarense TaxID=2846851 RepID=UPI001F2B52A7|nr:extensin family protein [Rhizobium alarense]MCF3641625.1 extensin family protein [Rhizobium alarense]
METVVIRKKLLVALVSTIVLAGATLPERGPVPEEKPAAAPEKADGKPEVTEERPVPADEDTSTPSEESAEKPSPPVKEDAAAYAACIGELRTMSASFEEQPAVDGDGGCGMEKPILLRSIDGKVSVDPPAQVRCETALALARWTSGSVRPALALSHPGETLKSLQQASGYVCRNRNGARNGRISEHALGNAIDIAGLAFESGRTLAIEPRDHDSTLVGALQRAIVASACLYFPTVLDPGSDAAHETHLHLDVRKRRNGFRYCW